MEAFIDGVEHRSQRLRAGPLARLPSRSLLVSPYLLDAVVLILTGGEKSTQGPSKKDISTVQETSKIRAEKAR